MVDNLEKILPLLDFKSPDEFYYLQILQRKKENPELGSNSRVIKNYYIRSKEHLVSRYDEIIAICGLFNARASLRLNRRSYTKVAFKAMTNIANTMANGEFRHIGKSYDRACGLGHSEPNKKWIIDVDTEGKWYLNILIKDIKIAHEGTINQILTVIPSKSGWHIITNPFRLDKFKELHPLIDVHKDNPTNLYIP